MTRSLAAAAVALALAAPSAASAASLTVSPEKRCYSSGESVNLLGSGFTPTTDPGNPNMVRITRDGRPFGTLPADATGAFNGVLRRLAQTRGQEPRTYTATDGMNGAITASTQITVSAVGVALRPLTGGPGRRLHISARGFTTGRTLWAHVIRGSSKRHLKVGRLTGACGRLKARRRLLRPGAAIGVYTIQFDTYRRYRPRRVVADRYTISVRRG